MTEFDDRESSRDGGEPLECYRFSHGSHLWLWTPNDVEVTIPAGTFIPDALRRTSIELGQEDSAGQVEWKVPRTNPVAALFYGPPPQLPVIAQAWYVHRDDESDVRKFFTGEVTGIRGNGSEVIITAASVTQLLQREVPTKRQGLQCFHVLYSSPGCNASEAAFTDEILVTSVDGSDVISNDFALRPDDWYRGGKMTHPDGEKRWIVKHVGDTVTLMNPFRSLASLTTVQASAGCDLLRVTCDGKFDNLVNHGAWPKWPLDNPHQRRLL